MGGCGSKPKDIYCETPEVPRVDVKAPTAAEAAEDVAESGENAMTGIEEEPETSEAKHEADGPSGGDSDADADEINVVEVAGSREEETTAAEQKPTHS
ncbi:hypothetical protein GW17_00045585 [Ensete ventricosum]|nr:hypothetical protein GW17_00045585 [Ensete ventricosum]